MSLPESCPLCAASRTAQRVVTAHVYGDKSGARAFYHCERCDVRYQFPGLTAEEEQRFYAAEFESFMAGRAGTAGGWQKVEEHIRANESTRVRRMRYLEPILGTQQDVLEIGCSSGFMLYPLIAAGHRCVGVEPSGAFGDYLRGRGLEVYPGLEALPQSVQARRFDLVMHFFVFEHIADPVAFLRKQLELVRPGGHVVLEIPNAADPLYTVYDVPAFERFYWSMAHPWYFSEASLRHVLEQVGRKYEIQLDQRYDLSNHMVWARDGRPGGMGRFTASLGTELEEDYKRALVKARRCDTLVGIIRNE